MTNNNSTTNSNKSISGKPVEEICNLAASLVDLCNDGIDDLENVTVAQLVAMKVLAGNIGALADRASGGGYRGDSLEWMGVK